jgi:hypothetical protein
LLYERLSPSAGLKVITLRSILAAGKETGTAEADQLEYRPTGSPPKPSGWAAPDESTAVEVEKAAAEFMVPANRLMAVRR